MIDAELIARVLDGRASPEERARVLVEADESPELLTLLADSAAAMEAKEAQVIPIRRRSTVVGVIVGIAAVLVAALTLPRVFGDRSDAPPIELSLAGGGHATQAARAGPWIETLRGGADDDRSSVSARIGARLVDYMTLGVDSVRGSVAKEIANALRSIPGGGIIAGRFDGQSVVTRQTIDDLEKVVDIDAFRAAGAGERLRLAALGDNEVLLYGPDLRESFASLSRDSKLPDEARAAAKLVNVALSQRAGKEVLQKVAEDFLVAVARGR
jgi:hypothetical protein